MKKKRKSQAEITQMKKVSALKNLYYNRYLMVRYFLAVFLFSNFYWALYTNGTWSMIIPLALLVMAIPPCIENIQCYGEKATAMNWTKRYYKAQMCVNIGLLLLGTTPLFKEIMPFLSDTITSRIIACGIYFIGFLMALSCHNRLRKIDTNSDKQYARIHQYEKAVKLHL